MLSLCIDLATFCGVWEMWLEVLAETHGNEVQKSYMSSAKYMIYFW